MTNEEYDIVIYARADFGFTLTVNDPDGNLIDLTGCTVSGQLRENAESQDHFDFVITHNNDEGQIFVKMPHGTTEKIPFSSGVYDIVMTDTYDRKEKIIYGKATIIPAVTR